MEKTYVIAWKSRIGAIIKQGTKLFTREEAEQLAAELNEDHPQLEHHIVNLRPTEPVAAEPAAAETERDPVIIHDIDFGGASLALEPIGRAVSA